MRLRINSLAYAVVFTISLAGAIAFAWPQSQAQGQAQDQSQARAKAVIDQLTRGIPQDHRHPILPIGAAAPDFDLPGVDGKNHKLSDYADAKVLVVLFASNHCPVMQQYEERFKQINDTYKSK